VARCAFRAARAPSAKPSSAEFEQPVDVAPLLALPVLQRHNAETALHTTASGYASSDQRETVSLAAAQVLLGLRQEEQGGLEQALFRTR
jgi:ABC-2 type transport system ATP-binding protein